MAYICYKSKFCSCSECEYFRYDEDNGGKACFGQKEAPVEENYYNFLENLKRSSITNMYGATPYLMAEFNISQADAMSVLGFWMNNYDILSQKYGWNK